MKLKLPNTHPVQALFYAAGLLSTAASVKGTLGYLLTETEGDLLLSGAGAVCLGLSAYFGWEVVFNHKGWGKRAAAVLIAAAASSLSAYTVYQHTAYPELEKQATAAAAQAQDAKDRATQVDATLRQQQADLRDQISELRKQNETDTGRADALSHSGKKSASRQAAQLRTTIAGREAEISKLAAQVDNYTQRLTATPTGETPAQASTAEPLVLSWAMLARASIYDLMTALFLLFAGWFRSHRQERDNREAGVLQAATETARETLKQLQAAVITCNAAIAHANKPFAGTNKTADKPFAHANTPTNAPANKDTSGSGQGKPEITQEAAIYLLENRAIPASEDGNITIEQAMAATGWGRPRATKLLEQAWQYSHLERKPAGRGWTYCYPGKHTQHTGNVIPMTRTA
jgi:hypothetical protein